MADFEQEKQQVQRAPTATAPTAASADGAMHETRMNVTRHRRAAMRKAGGGAAAGPQVDIPEGGGKQLDGGLKQTMEKKLGADLSGVNIHTGGASANASEKLNARAFTVGNDVHFNAGQFDPSSKEGTKLLAHELTHVVQGQKGGVQKKEDEGGEADAEGKDGEALEVSDPEEPAEQEADAVADQATADMGEGGAAAEAASESAEAKATGGDDEGGGKKAAEAEGGESAAAETEEAAPTTAAKLKAPISAKFASSVARSILRKKAYRDEVPEAEEKAAAPDAAPEGEGEAKPPEAEAKPPEGADSAAAAPEAKGEEESKSVESESPESEAPSKSVAAKLKGVHRKIFRAGTGTMQLPKNQMTPAEREALTKDEQSKYKEFQSRVKAAFSTGLMDGTLNPEAKAKEVWDKIKAKLQGQAGIDAMSKDKRVQMNSDAYQQAIAQITPIATELAKLSSVQFTQSKKFGFWSTVEGEELGRQMNDLTLETSGIGAVFDNIPTMNGKDGGGGWDPELWGGLSQAYAQAVAKEVMKGGKEINVCVGGKADRGNNVWAAVEGSTLEKTLKEAGMTLASVTKYHAAAATSKDRSKRALDKTKGANGLLGTFTSRDAACDRADAHFNALPEPAKK